MITVMKEYIKPSIKKKTLLSESALLEGSITDGVINPDDQGVGTPDNPVIFEAPQQKHFNVWDD